MRNVVLGNGTMMLNFDTELNIRDLYWPYGGFENHGDRNRTNFGIFADNKFSWFFDSDWHKDVSYVKDTAVTNIKAVNHDLELELSINDALHWAEDLYLRRIVVRNRREYAREIKLIFYQDLSIKGIEAGDSALYDPVTGGVYHYKKNCYLLINCLSLDGDTKEYSAGVKRYRGREGTFRDAEDGVLSLNPVADGPVDSAIGVRVRLEPNGTGTVYYWIIAGYRLADLRMANQRFLLRSPEEWINDIIRYHRGWLKKTSCMWQKLPLGISHLYKNSLFTIRSQLDRKGAVVASPDADTFLVARDHYMYLWPRDGAMVAHALDVAGYPEEARRIYVFASGIIEKEGYFLQRYNTDGTPGCTWHPMVLDGRPVPPIQEDETALVIWALAKHCLMYEDNYLACQLYEPLIKPALTFMSSYLDEATGLCLPSWDLWEERRGIFSFSCGAVYGALRLGSILAQMAGDESLSRHCLNKADKLKEGMSIYLYSEGLGRFLRGIYPEAKGELIPDLTLDASLYGIWAFDAFPPDDWRVRQTMETVEKGLWVKTEVGGVARYFNDYYHRISDDQENVPGNPWLVTTLWLADWKIAVARTIEDLNEAERLIEWAVKRATSGLLLPEQVHPYDGRPLSVCPLTWSHAAFVKTVADYMKKKESFLTH